MGAQRGCGGVRGFSSREQTGHIPFPAAGSQHDTRVGPQGLGVYCVPRRAASRGGHLRSLPFPAAPHCLQKHNIYEGDVEPAEGCDFTGVGLQRSSKGTKDHSCAKQAPCPAPGKCPVLSVGTTTIRGQLVSGPSLRARHAPSLSPGGSEPLPRRWELRAPGSGGASHMQRCSPSLGSTEKNNRERYILGMFSC